MNTIQIFIGTRVESYWESSSSLPLYGSGHGQKFEIEIVSMLFGAISKSFLRSKPR
jgi:hypothetical protein